MTKREFVEMLNKNFKDDEEITFLYNDPGFDDKRVTNAEVIQNHKREYHDCKYYILDTDNKWKNVSFKDYEMLMYYGKKGRVEEGKLVTDIKKVIHVF